MGGYHTDTLTGKVAKVGVASASLNNSGTCFQVGGVNYQVTAGKTFYITGFLPLAVASIHTLAIRYADDAALTTNPVVILDIATVSGAAIVAGNLQQPIPVFGITAPASKYVGIFQTTASAGVHQVLVFGYEA
jgi:hypothetical protein